MTVIAEATGPNIAFWIIAAVMAAAAIAVVTVPNVVHAALSLVIVLAGVAAQYILLQAEFVGLVQVLIYIGAVIILFLFGISWLPLPYIFTQFIGFGLFLVATQAELTQTPFDMPVAESELVAGYMVEYSGFRFLFFFMGEFGTAFAFAGIAATLFLGGWAVPGVEGTMADLLGPLVLFTKIMLVAFLIFWVRFTYPRLREDQLQAIAWKYLIPISLLNILVTGIFKVVA